MKWMIYDCETENAVLARGETPLEGINYCRGWGDKAGMGISVICARVERDYRVFLKDNMAAFQELALDPDVLCIGYNNQAFDDPLVEEVLGVRIVPERSWDLYAEVRKASGRTHARHGPSLDTLAKANGLAGKSGSGALAPVLWQHGKVGEVIDYCLNDIMLTVRLVELAVAGELRDHETGVRLVLPPPALGEGF